MESHESPHGLSFQTLAIHAGHSPARHTDREIIQPISLSTNYLMDRPENPVTYSRLGHNSTRSGLETCISQLEGSRFSLTYSSGQAATQAVVNSVLKAGDHVICGRECYGGTGLIFKSMTDFGIECSFVDSSCLSEVAAAVRDNTRLIWIEAFANPTLRVTDVSAVAQIKLQHQSSSGRKTLLAVDNTFLTSFLMKPLSHGADIVMHSMTKFMNGHGDVVMGTVCTNDDSLATGLKRTQSLAGSVSSPMDCFLVWRGLKTLALRMRCVCESAMRIAEMLEQQPKVRKCLYPGLESHAQHELAKRQSPNGFSGIVSFYIGSSGQKAGSVFAQRLKIFKVASSLGGCESLVNLPLHMVTLSESDATILSHMGIDDSLIRLSIGLESVNDLIADLRQALNSVP